MASSKRETAMELDDPFRDTFQQDSLPLDAAPNATLNALLRACCDRKASDLHIASEAAPQLRVSGRLEPLWTTPLTASDVTEIVRSSLSEPQRTRFERDGVLRFALTLPGMARFRGTCLKQRGTPVVLFRHIPLEPVPLASLELPAPARDIAQHQRGLILIVGTASSGKTTTFASLLDHINEVRRGHIFSIEEPVEFVLPHKSCLLTQIEVGSDIPSGWLALEHALRADVDVVGIGDLGSNEELEAALALAEGGKLVIACVQGEAPGHALARLLGAFPEPRGSSLRRRLARMLDMTIHEVLLPGASSGQVAAFGVLVPGEAVRRLIVEGRAHEIDPMTVERGSQPLARSIQALLDAGRITREAAGSWG